MSDHPGVADRAIHAMLRQLLDIAPADRKTWLMARIPGDVALRERILAAVESQRPTDRTDDGHPASPVAIHEWAQSAPPYIGRFEIIRLLGAGGMGRVFLAHDPRIQREVVIKVIRSAQDDALLRQRFLAEARAAGGLRHPNIVTVYDVDEDRGSPFIVMEYIPGRTLLEVTGSRERLTLAKKLTILAYVCEALSCAHAAGIIHRDLKPANVMLTVDDEVKVLDFGIARFVTGVREGPDVVTNTRTIMGTPGYIAPELFAGGTADVRSDIFALGVLAYELLCGQLPFGAGSESARRLIAGEVTPFSAHGVEMPEAVEELIRRALAPRPLDRYSSMALLMADLRQASASLTVSRAPLSGAISAPLGPRPSVLVLVGTALALLLATFAAVQRMSSGRVAVGSDLQSAGSGAAAVAAPTATPEATASSGAAGEKSAGSLVAVPARESRPGAGSASEVQPQLLAETVVLPAPPADTGVSESGPDPVMSAPQTDVQLVDARDGSRAILDVLRALELAFEDLSTPRLKQVYPTLSQAELAVWERLFLESRSYRVTIRGERIIEQTPTAARVSCLIERAFTLRTGDSRAIAGPAEIQLQQREGEWAVSAINGVGWR